jgi:putative addiction module component (TIGR02574 family)
MSVRPHPTFAQEPHPRRAQLAVGRAPAQLESMSARPILDEILRLPADERLQLVEDIWASLAASPEGVPIPEWHRELLDDRLADPTEQATRSWDDVKANARRPRR